MRRVALAIAGVAAVTVLLPAGCVGVVAVAGGAITSAAFASTCYSQQTGVPARDDQATVAANVASAMREEGWGDRGVQLAIATAWAESRLTNLASGDGTSRGAFQQLAGYAGLDLVPDPARRWWGPWSGQTPPPGASADTYFTPSNAWGLEGWALHDRRMDVAVSTRMFSDAARSAFRASGIDWRAWGSQNANATPGELIDLARKVQRFAAADTNYQTSLTGIEADTFRSLLAEALSSAVHVPAEGPMGDLPRDGVLVFGDSLAVGYAAAAPERGFGGPIRQAARESASLSDVLNDPSWVARLRDAPHRIVVSLGTNGPVASFPDDAEDLMRAVPRETQVWWVRSRSGTALTVNTALDHLAATDARVHQVDLSAVASTSSAPDGVHLTPDGYRAAWTLISQQLAAGDDASASALVGTDGCDPNSLDGTVDPASIPAPDREAAVAVAAALAAVQGGGTYVVEGNGPVNFDCSGLTSWAWGKAGVTMDSYSYTQRALTATIPRELAQPGDLVFWFRDSAHHVAIVTNVESGQITIAEAASPSSGLQVRTLGGSWDDAHLSGFGRVSRA